MSNLYGHAKHILDPANDSMIAESNAKYESGLKVSEMIGYYERYDICSPISGDHLPN